MVTVQDYADLKQVKERVNIPQSNTNSDEKLGSFMKEADSFVNSQFSIFEITPLSNPDPEIISLASGLAASIYNYWQTPAKDRTLDGVREWKKSIADHLKAVKGQKTLLDTSGNSFSSTKGVTGTET
jgi:hypothetical protein